MGRLTGVAVGVSDIEPREKQEMTPTELKARRCSQITKPVGGGETVTLTCPPGGVTGLYLIVQILDRKDYLTLCEVEAGRAIVIIFHLSRFYDYFSFSLPLL